MSRKLVDPLTLPCGARLSNRVAKAAITEGLADALGWPTAEMDRLYQGWSEGGFGLMITGNIIVDGDHLERPGNIVLDREPSAEQMSRLRSWTGIATAKGAHLWAQLSHSGRQTPNTVNSHPLSSSAIPVGLPGGLFGSPQAMVSAEIDLVIKRFAAAARNCKAAGFTGVQIHAAHGYLLSCFLSPRANTRTDEWGGSLENRSRLLMAVVRAVREAVGRGFPVGVKLNSADFQKGGFNAEDSNIVALQLQAAGVDLLEISGGSYESPAMVGVNGGGADLEAPSKKASTVAREAYFLDFARRLRSQLTMPIMLTGGLRSRAGMEAALGEGVDVLGVARPVCVDLRAVKALLNGQVDHLDSWEERLRRDRGLFSSNSPFSLIRALVGFSGLYWFYAQIYRHGRNQPPAKNLWPIRATVEVMLEAKAMLAKRQALRVSSNNAAVSPGWPVSASAAK